MYQRKSPGLSVPSLGMASKTASGARELYDEWASTYDLSLRSWGYPIPGRVAASLLNASVPPSGRIVDLGCGTGLGGECVRTAFIGGDLVGLDISGRSLDYVRDNKPGVYTALQEHNLDEPLPSVVGSVGTADAFISCGVFSYVERFDVLFPEVCERLKPGGVLVFSHHVSYWDEDRRGCRSAAEGLQAKGDWIIERVGEPEPYMPRNPDPDENSKRVRIIIIRKCA